MVGQRQTVKEELLKICQCTCIFQDSLRLWNCTDWDTLCFTRSLYDAQR